MTKTIVTRARVEGLVIAAIAAVYLWQTHQIPDLFQMPGVPGPTAFPTLVGLIFGLAGLWRLLAPVATVDAEQPWAEDDCVADDAPVARGGVRGWIEAHGRFYGLWVVLLGYLAVMPIAGFPVATVVALAAMFALLGERRWALILTLSLVVTVVLYVVFAWGLGVNLPQGALAPLLK
jgi:hypothetical protein